jgi:SAM-dependent methyltransferase
MLAFLQKFVGAHHGKRAKKGIFITTGPFSSEAGQYVATVDPKVVDDRVQRRCDSDRARGHSAAIGSAVLDGYSGMSPTPSPKHVKDLLRDIYDRAADERGRRPAPAWEVEQRDTFLSLLQSESIESLLELGAATGADSAFFANHGLHVVSTDLSPEMVLRCRARGLEAHVMDVNDLQFDENSFDAAYAKNCLVHVPQAEVDSALAEISRVIRPNGLFYLSVYGGRDFEGVWQGDSWNEKRFFSFRSDEHLLELVRRCFNIHSFERILEGFGGYHYQSLILRKPVTPRRSGEGAV